MAVAYTPPSPPPQLGSGSSPCPLQSIPSSPAPDSAPVEAPTFTNPRSIPTPRQQGETGQEMTSAAMADACKILAGETGRDDQTDVDVEASPSLPAVEKMTGATTPPSPAKTPSQVENGSSETRKLCHATQAKENSEFGAGVAGFAVSVVVAWYFLSPEDRGAHNERYIVPMLFGFICFISGVFLMLLNMYLLEISELKKNKEHLDSQNQGSETLRMLSKYLSYSSSTLMVVTLVSPLILSGYKPYRYVGLALLVVVTAPLAVVRWYVGLKTEGGEEEAAYREHKEQLETLFKFLTPISNSAFSGLIALVVNYNITGGSGSTKGAALVAIFFTYTTAIWGLLSMDLRAKVLEINSETLRRWIIRAMWSAIIIMNSLLACAVLAEVFAIVQFSILAAFAPCVFAAALYIFIEHWVVLAAHNNETSEFQEVLLKWKAERGIKITMWSFTAIIGIFGGFLHGKVESLKACIILLTSAFMSGFTLTVVTINPNSASAGLAAATTVLEWTAVATFAAAIFAVIIAMVFDIS